MSGRVIVGGAAVDLVDEPEALDRILAALESPGVPLGVVSINLDHIHHLRQSGRFAAALADRDDLEWLSLIDGAPVAVRVSRSEGRRWPRLAGSDLMGPLLERSRGRFRFGVLGGSATTHEMLAPRLAEDFPGLELVGCWSPTREELEDPEASRALAAEIAAAGVDILLVSLGKPRQEQWIAEHGAATGASVLLAFGAVVDFLAGRIARAPRLVSAVGMEWAWRLISEPRRLARRYLVQGPPALAAVLRPPISSRPLARDAEAPEASAAPSASPASRPGEPGRFVPEGPVDVAVVVVGYRSADRIDPLIEDLRRETADQSVRVVIVDNDSPDDLVERVRAHSDAVLVRAEGNVGYSGGINAAAPALAGARDILVLNPDLRVDRGAVAVLRARRRAQGAAVVVPLLLDDEGRESLSLRREPSVLGAVGDALVGARMARRPARWSETVRDPLAYRYAHPVEWATGAALLVDAETWWRIGAWDESFFLYSEETDFFRRVRAAGGEAWFEPTARMRHSEGGSGGSDELYALMTVNKVRYAEKHLGPVRAAALRGALVVQETLRSRRSANRLARRALLHRASWSRLPRARRTPPPGLLGAVVIPAHQEAAVIARTLAPLAPLVAEGRIEVVVSCNACTDDTAAIARTVPGVRVIESDRPSKAAALNRADAAATAWPRLYVDADIELAPSAVVETLRVLGEGRLLAARPAARFDLTGVSPLVRCYYRARRRLPGPRAALWGAGVYGMTESGHARLGEFPDATADDLVVDLAFGAQEKAVLDTVPARVRVPRTADTLVSVLARGKKGDRQLGVEGGSSTARALLLTVRGPASFVDAVVYAGFGAAARRRARQDGPAWARDDTSRS